MPEEGAVYLPAAVSVGSTGAMAGWATRTALSAIVAADSLNSFRTAHSSSCSTGTKLSMFGDC